MRLLHIKLMKKWNSEGELTRIYKYLNNTSPFNSDKYRLLKALTVML